MSYASLMTHLSAHEVSPDFTRDLSGLAETWNAHLDVICHGVDRMTTGFYYGGIDPMMMQQSYQHASEEADALAKQMREALRNTTATWGVETCVSALGALSRSVSQRARFADLLVLPGPYAGEGSQPDAEAVLEGALFGGQAPVLIVPDKATLPSAPKQVVIAWNESAEAMNAVRSALPLLKSADNVRVTVIDPPRHGPDRSDPGGPLSVFLTRHDVKVEIDVLGKSMPRVSDVLMRHANDTGSDMVVMGAYGHSRFREAILGGATRDMLENSTLPILMAH